MKRSESIKELATALAKAQKKMESAKREHVAKVVSKKGEGSSYSYNYADLANVLEACRDPLADNGLSLVQEPTADGPAVKVITLLMHESGEWIEFDPLVMLAGGADPQSVGSAITYGRRYTYGPAVGVAFETDDDGNAASGNSAETAKRDPLPECSACKTNKHVIVGKPEFGGGLVCYKTKGGCGAKWQPAETKPAETAKSSPPPAQPAECPEYANSLSTVLHDLGCRNAREAQAVITLVRPGIMLASCKVNPQDATAVVDAIDALCQFQGMTFATIYNDAIEQAKGAAATA